MQPLASISTGDFHAVRSFVYREIGVSLSDAKRALVVSRLAGRLRTLGVRSYREYVRRAESDPAERQRLIDAITTNETRFFREPAHFDLLEREVVPAWRAAADEGTRTRKTRVWSAGCSTGEEPYSIAMLLASALPASEGWTHELLATDISSRVLEKAAAAVYPLARKDDIPLPLLKKFMLRGVGSRHGSMAVDPLLRALVRFAPLNLNDESAYPAGSFDAIFCRNVLIYFSVESRRRVIDAFVARLVPGGLLFLGHAETLSGHAGMRPLAPHVYVRSE